MRHGGAVERVGLAGLGRTRHVRPHDSATRNLTLRPARQIHVRSVRVPTMVVMEDDGPTKRVDFPAPVARLNIGFVWACPDFAAWAKKTGRL